MSAALVHEIAEGAWVHALEITQIIELLGRQNTNRINGNLSDAGAARAAMAVRNSLIARVVLLVSGCYGHARKGDKHIRRAFELIRDRNIRSQIEADGSNPGLIQAEQLWAQLNRDPRLATLLHFRNKYVAHSTTPIPSMPVPNVDEFFGFSKATADVIEKLAHAVGATKETLNGMRDEIASSAQQFWAPWDGLRASVFN